MYSIPHGPLSLIVDYSAGEKEEIHALALSQTCKDLRELVEAAQLRKRSRTCKFSLRRQYLFPNLRLSDTPNISTDYLKWTCSQGLPLETALARAASLGKMDCVQWLLALGGAQLDADRAMCAAAGTGQVAVLRHFKECGFAVAGFASLLLIEAAKNGQLEMMRWLVLENDCRPSASTMKYAAHGGNVEMMVWLREQEGCHNLESDALSAAACSGHLESVKWLVQAGSRWDEDIMMYAAKRGHLHILQWLREQGCTWNQDTMFNAASGGNLQVVKWLHGEGCPWDPEAVKEALRNDHVELVEWLIVNGCEFERDDPLLVVLAATEGLLEMVQFLVQNGCMVHPNAIQFAAGNGHMPIVEWLHFSQGSGLHAGVMQAAVEKGLLPMAIWLHERGCIMEMEDLMTSAAWSGHVEILQWLVKEHDGVITQRVMGTAVRFGELEVVAWLAENNCPWCPEIMVPAVELCDLELVQWLIANAPREELRFLSRASAECRYPDSVIGWLEVNKLLLPDEPS